MSKISIHSLVELSPAGHQAGHSPLIHCVQPTWLGATWANARSASSTTGDTGAEASKREGGTSFVQELMYFRYCTLAVAMPILANDLLPGVFNRKASFLCHSDFTGHTYNIQLPFASFQLINNQIKYIISLEGWKNKKKGTGKIVSQ